MALEEERKLEAVKCPKCSGKIQADDEQLKCGQCGFLFGVDQQVSLMDFERDNIADILDGTKQLFSKLTDKSIEIYRSDDPTVSEDTSEKQISVGVDMSSESVKTDFERFMAQLIYNSPNIAMNRRTSAMVKDLDDKRKVVGKKLVRKLYQLFENRRCESNFGENYGGSLTRFKQARQDRQARVLIEKGLVDSMGNKQLQKLDDPFTALELAELDYDLTGTDYEYANEFMKQAEGGLGRSGAIQLAKQYWNKYCLDWIKKLTLPPVTPGGQGGEGDPDDDSQEGPDGTEQKGGEGEGNPDDQEDGDDEDGEQDPEDGQTGGIQVPSQDGQESDDDGEEQEGQDGSDGSGKESDGEDSDSEDSESSSDGNEEDSDKEQDDKEQDGEDGNGDPVNGNPAGQEGQKKGKDYEQKDDRPWRKQKMSNAQGRYLDSLGLPEQSKYPEMTKGEASDLIEKWKDMQQEQKRLEQELANQQEDKELDNDDASRDIEAWREMENKAEVNKIIDNLKNYKGKEKLKMAKNIEGSLEQGAEDIEAVDDMILSKGLMDLVNPTPNFDEAIRSCWLADIENEDDQVELDAINIDEKLVKKMGRFFRKFKGKKKEILDEEGNDLDVDALIDDYFKPQRLCFREEENKKGLDVVIAYDQSGSMNGAPMQIVREMVGTLLKSMDQSPKIDVKALGWASQTNYNGDGDVRIEEISDWKQVTKIKSRGSTPMTEAIVFTGNYLNTKMKGDKKLLFVITDGGPNGSAYMSAAQKIIRDIRANKGIVIGIRIGRSYGVDEIMTEYFGKNGYVVFDGAEEMSKFIKSKVKKMAMRYLN